MKIGIHIKALRKEKGYTQLQLAKKSQVTQVAIAKIEGGLIKDPGISTVVRIANGLDVDINELLKDN